MDVALIALTLVQTWENNSNKRRYMISTISHLSLFLSLSSLKHSTYFQIAAVLTNTLWAVSYNPEFSSSPYMYQYKRFSFDILVTTRMWVSLKIQFPNNYQNQDFIIPPNTAFLLISDTMRVFLTLWLLIPWE